MIDYNRLIFCHSEAVNPLHFAKKKTWRKLKSI